MKRFALIITLVASMMMFGGCKEEIVSYLPDSHWILYTDGMTEGHRLALTFFGDQMEVNDGSYKTPPFTSSQTWNYHITEDSELYMWRYEYDSDGYESRESYTLKMSINADVNSLTLVYDPWIGSTHTYNFERR